MNGKLQMNLRVYGHIGKEEAKIIAKQPENCFFAEDRHVNTDKQRSIDCSPILWMELIYTKCMNLSSRYYSK